MPNYLKALPVDDPYIHVRPKKGVLARAVHGIVSHPRKIRWNAYLRACRAIPKSSPVHGTCSWKRINRRRHQLIDRMFRDKRETLPAKQQAEFEALQKVCGTVASAHAILTLWLSQRLMRRLLARIDEALRKNSFQGVNKRRQSGMKKS